MSRESEWEAADLLGQERLAYYRLKRRWIRAREDFWSTVVYVAIFGVAALVILVIRMVWGYDTPEHNATAWVVLGVEALLCLFGVVMAVRAHREVRRAAELMALTPSQDESRIDP